MLRVCANARLPVRAPCSTRVADFPKAVFHVLRGFTCHFPWLPPGADAAPARLSSETTWPRAPGWHLEVAAGLSVKHRCVGQQACQRGLVAQGFEHAGARDVVVGSTSVADRKARTKACGGRTRASGVLTMRDGKPARIVAQSSVPPICGEHPQ